MISAAVRTPYLRACLNQSRAPLTRKLLFNMSARTIVTTAEVPKVCCYSFFFFSKYTYSNSFISFV